MSKRLDRLEVPPTVSNEHATFGWNSRTGTGYGQSSESGASWVFVPGPIYLNRLLEVYPLGKRAIVVWLLVQVATKMRRGAEGGWVTLPRRELNRFGIDGAAKGRAIASLEEAGLVLVQRQGRRSLRLRLPDPGDLNSGADRAASEWGPSGTNVFVPSCDPKDETSTNARPE